MRSKYGVLIAPAIDIAAYLLLAGLGQMSTAGAQSLSFGAALVFAYLPALGAHPQMRSRRWTAGFGLRPAAVVLLVFFLRSGILIDAMGAWGWRAPAAIAMAAVATALMMHASLGFCASDRGWRIGAAGWETGAIGVIAAAAALRVVYGDRVELLPEETYYWNYARHLDIGYLDHPPMVAWLIALGTRLFGGAEIGVRAGALCAGAIATFFTFRLTDNLFGRPSALMAAVLMQTLPFFFLAGMLMTPDAPLTAAWAASLYFLERALVAGRREAWWGAGLCLGLGLLSKYTIALVGLSALIFAIVDPAARRWLRRPEPYGAAVLAFAVFSPVILWNARNGWVSFLFQTSHRLADRPQFALHKLIASAIVLLTPTGIAAVALALSRRTAPGSSATPGAMPAVATRARGWRFLRVATLTPLAVFTLFSFRHEVKLDWTGAPWTAAIPMLACGIVESSQGVLSGMKALLRRSWVPTVMALLLVYGAGLYHLTWGIPGLAYGRHAELVPVGWRELGGRINAIAEGAGADGDPAVLVVGMDRYAIASELAFYAPDQSQGVARTSSGHLFGQVGLMYERWFPPTVQRGRTLVLVAWRPEDLGSDRVSSAVERLGAIQQGVLTRGNEVIRRFYYRLGYGYRGVERQDSAAD